MVATWDYGARVPAAPAASSTVLKAIDVLLAVEELRNEGARLVDLHRRTGHDKTTLLRLLNAWRARGFLIRDEDGRYRLGDGILKVTGAYLDGLGVRTVALPLMRELADQVRETCHLGKLDGTQVIYLAKIEAPQTIRMHSRVGATMPAYSTALGKALLAFERPDILDRVTASEMPPLTARTITSPAKLREELDQTQRRGYAIDDVENEEGVRCVASPIFDNVGVVAAISVSAPSYRFTLKDARRTGPMVASVAGRISERLGDAVLAEAVAP